MPAVGGMGGQSDAELRFQATMEDDVSPQLDRLEKKLKEAGASDAEISMFLKAYDEASPQIEEVQKNLDKMPKEQIINIKAASDEAKANLDSFTKGAEETPIRLKFLDNLQEVTDRLFNLRTRYALPLMGSLGGGAATGMLYGLGAGAGAVGIGTAAVGAIQQGIQVNQEMEQSMVTLTQTLRDQAQARQEMSELVKFAQVSPFQYQDVLAADVRLRSYQIPSLPGEGGPDNRGWLQAAGDMAAAMGTPITQAVEAIADARQGYFIRMMTYGIRMMREDFQKGGRYAGLSYEQGLARALDRFSGSMEMQSKTLVGVMSNIKDIVQQQIYMPLGQEPFGIKKELATNLYNTMNDPAFLRQLGLVMEDIQTKLVEFWDLVEQGQTLFRAHMLEPLKDIAQNLVKIGQTFGQAFGGATMEIVQTIATALLGITGFMTRLGAGVPKFVEFYGIMKALSMLGFKDLTQPFFDLTSALNPLTFSVTKLISGLAGLPGMLARLGMYSIVKNFIDTREATAALNSQFSKLSETSLDKLNTDVERLAINLGKSSTDMKNLVTYAAQAMEGLPGTEQKRAQRAIDLARQGEYFSEQFGVGAQDYVTMITDQLQRLGKNVDDEKLSVLNRKAVETAIGLEALGQSADRATELLSMYGDKAGAAGFDRFGSAAPTEAMLLGMGELRDQQVQTYKNPMGLMNSMYERYATPPITDLRRLKQAMDDQGLPFDVTRYFDLNRLGTSVEMSSDEAHRRELSGLGPLTLRDTMRKAYGTIMEVKEEGDKGTPQVSYLEQYLANEEKQRQTQQMIGSRAPTIAGKLPEYINPAISRDMFTGVSSLAAGQTPNVNQVVDDLLKTDKTITNLNLKIQEQQQVITDLTNKQVQWQIAMDLVQVQMQKLQHQMVPYQRALEDLQLATQKFAFENVRPLEREMTRLGNTAAIYSDHMRRASYEMNKYSAGLLNGEQAMKNQLHDLELYNKQLQLLQLSYTQIGAELGRSTYEQGFQSRVEPMAGLSLNMQMQRLQREEQRKQLEYELTYGEKHYQMQQAARTRWQRTEMPFDTRMEHIRNARIETDKYTEAQYRLQNQQFDLSQKMFKLNEYMADQQDKMTALQIQLTSMQQSGAMREMQDEQYDVQMTLGRVNRELEKQNINLVKWQDLLDPLKDKKDKLNQVLSTWLTSEGKKNYEAMIDYFEEIGVLLPKQADRMRQELERMQKGQSAVDQMLGDPRSGVEKWFDIFTQTLEGLFTGQTWSLIRREIAGAGIPILSSIAGGPAGGAAAAVAGPALGAYGLFTGGRMAYNVGRLGMYGGLSGASRLLPDAMQTNILTRITQEGGFLSRLAAGLSKEGSGTFAKALGNNLTLFLTTASREGSDLQKAIGTAMRGSLMGWTKEAMTAPLSKVLRTAFTDPFRAIQSSRMALGGIAGAPFFPPFGSAIGAGFMEHTTYRQLFPRIFAGAGLAKDFAFHPFKTMDAWGRSSGLLDYAKMAGREVEALPAGVGASVQASRLRVGEAASQIPLLGRLTGRIGGTFDLVGYVEKMDKAASLTAKMATPVKSAIEALGPVGTFITKFGGILRVAGKVLAPVAYAITAITGISDLLTIFQGEADKGTWLRTGGMVAGGVVGGVLTGGNPAGIAMGAMIGQFIGDAVNSIDWGAVKDAVGDAFSYITKGGLRHDILYGLGYMEKIIENTLGLIPKFLSKAWAGREKIVQGFTNALLDAGGAFIKTLGKIIAGIARFLTQTPGEMWADIWRVVASIGNGIADIVYWLGQRLSDAWSFLQSLPVIGGLFGGGESDSEAFQEGQQAAPNFAGGLNRVPYDNYSAVLHKDEAILTASQANEWRGRVVAGATPEEMQTQANLLVGAQESPTFEGVLADTEDKLKKHNRKVREFTVKVDDDIESEAKKHHSRVKHIQDNSQDHQENSLKKHGDIMEKSADKGFGKTHDVIKDWTQKNNSLIGSTTGKIKGLNTSLKGLGKGTSMPGMPGEDLTYKDMTRLLSGSEHTRNQISNFTDRLEKMPMSKLKEIERRAIAMEERGEEFPDEYWDALQAAMNRKRAKRHPFEGSQIPNKYWKRGTPNKITPTTTGGDSFLRDVADGMLLGLDNDGGTQTTYEAGWTRLKNKNKKAEDENDRHRRREADADNKDKEESLRRENKFNETLKTFKHTTNKALEMLQEDHNKKNSQSVKDGMKDSWDKYDRGWKDIFGTSADWIDKVQKAFKGIDEDIGLTDPKGGGGRHGDNSDRGGSGFTNNRAHGGLITGDKYDKRGTLIRVGEEGFDEMVIPLAPHRKDRARNLMRQAKAQIGEYANGGIIQEGQPGVDLAYFPAKAAYDKAFASGGVAQPPGDPGPEVVQEAYAKVVGAFLKRFNMDLTQGYNPSGPSVSAGHNYLDAAPSLDVVPLDGNWDGAFAQGLKWALAHGMQVGYDGQYGTQSWSGHGEGDHAHIDWGGDTDARGLGGARGPMSMRGLGGMGNVPNIPENLKKMGPAGLRMYQALQRKKKQYERFGGSSAGGFGDIPVSGNLQQMAKRMVIATWGASQWPYFNDLVNRESGWNPEAVNSSSGAAGLAQALPPSKYPDGAWPYEGAQSARLQLEWMINYIKERYGDPAGAIAFHDANNWYAAGGIIPGFALGGFTSNVPKYNLVREAFEGLGSKTKVRKAAGKIAGYKVPSQFANINHQYEDHWAPDWSGETLPFKQIAALAEWAGDVIGSDVPGVTFAQVTKGESGGRPGSAGVDPGGTKGYGMWAVTSPFADAIVKKYGGYEQMWNPVKNALAMAEIYGDMGLSAWYGTRYVTDPNAHYSGKGYAGGIGRVPSTGPANLHEGEMVLPQGLADLFRKMAKGGGGGDSSNDLIRRWNKVANHLESIDDKIRKVEKHLAHAEDKDEKTKWKEKLGKLQDRAAAVKERQRDIKQEMRKETVDDLIEAGDETGGEGTLAAVTSQKERFRAMTKSAVEHAKRGDRYRKQSRQAERARDRMEKLQKGGVTKKERKKIKKLRKQFNDPGQVLKEARGKAYERYLNYAEEEGINADLIDDITGRQMSNKQLHKYEHGGKGKDKDKDRERRSEDYEKRSIALLEQLAGKDNHVNVAVKAQGAKITTTKRAAPRRRK